MHAYTVKLEDAKWTVEISPSTQYGYFENNINGNGGGLWFEDNQLVDFDGMFDLPKSVFNMLVGAGYDLSGMTA